MADKYTAEKTINGSFGKLLFEGVVMANVSSVEARITVANQSIMPAGSRVTQYKAMGIEGSGSFTIWRVSSEIISRFVDAFSKSSDLTALGGGASVNGLSLNIQQNDPEIRGTGGPPSLPDMPTVSIAQREDIQLGRVKLWELPIGFSVDDLLSQQITFTFEEMTMVKSIV